MRSNPCFVYVIGTIHVKERSSMRTYVGWSNDLNMRISKHNKGTGAKSTRGWQWELLYVEKFSTRGDAMSREWYLKRDRKFRKSLLKNWAS